MESWAAVLRAVDAQFIDDVDFVAIEWGKTLSTTFAEQDKLFSKKCEELRKKVEDAQGETFPSKLLAFVDKLNEEIGGLRLLFEVEKTYASVLRK
jgi:hypothetical protein